MIGDSFYKKVPRGYTTERIYYYKTDKGYCYMEKTGFAVLYTKRISEAEYQKAKKEAEHGNN